MSRPSKVLNSTPTSDGGWLRALDGFVTSEIRPTGWSARNHQGSRWPRAALLTANPIPPPAHRRSHRAKSAGSPTVLRIERRSVAVADAAPSHHEHGYQIGPQSTQGPALQVRLRRH